jgi:hypothetical protein
MQNLSRVVTRMLRVPPGVNQAAAAQLKIEVDDLVAAQKRAAPVDPASDDPGKFRDSIHAYPTPNRPLSFRIIADAKDAAGKFIGANIEQGHRAVDGSHVAARPSFWPTYRARKKGMRKRISAAARKVLKQTDLG